MRLIVVCLLCLPLFADERDAALSAELRKILAERLQLAELHLQRAQAALETGLATEMEVRRAHFGRARCLYDLELVEDFGLVRDHPLVVQLQRDHGIVPEADRPADPARSLALTQTTSRYLAAGLEAAEAELRQAEELFASQLIGSDSLNEAGTLRGELRFLLLWEELRRAELENLGEPD